MSGLDSKDRMEMLGIMLTVMVRHGYQDVETAGEFFHHAQSMGIHVLPDHFYSPIPNTARLTGEVWTRRFDEVPGWDLNVAGQLELLGELSAWADEMKDTPSKQVTESGYFWSNPQFCATDAAFYHSMIRMMQPRQVLEIGAGYSTMVSTRAAGFNKDTRVRCIEPYPMDALKNGMPGLDELIHSRLQSVPVSEFESLQANDILFVDSTHVGKIDSDVNYIFFNILPRLRPGVIVHFHDIFLPKDYPQGWVIDHRLFWNEQYFLLAFLLFNPRVEVLLAASYLGAEHAKAIEAAYPFLPTFGGSSFWLRYK
jgi:predicted O-methyltransferase YrrM